MRKKTPGLWIAVLVVLAVAWVGVRWLWNAVVELHGGH